MKEHQRQRPPKAGEARVAVHVVASADDPATVAKLLRSAFAAAAPLERVVTAGIGSPDADAEADGGWGLDRLIRRLLVGEFDAVLFAVSDTGVRRTLRIESVAEARKWAPEDAPQRAVIYSRSATVVQTDVSRCREEIERCGLTFSGLYNDSGVSFLTLEREALKRLLADAAAGRFEVVLVESWDRLARAPGMLLYIEAELARCGVAVRALDGHARGEGRSPRSPIICDEAAIEVLARLVAARGAKQ